MNVYNVSTGDYQTMVEADCFSAAARRGVLVLNEISKIDSEERDQLDLQVDLIERDCALKEYVLRVG